MPFESSYLPYSDQVETLLPDEQQLIEETLASMMRQLGHTYEKHHHAIRGTHSKSHAFLKGRLEVYEGLPEELRQGLFAASRSYPVVIRLASILGEIASDRIKTQRGFSWKVLGVEGEMLPGHEGQHTQDFLMDEGKTFPVADMRSFLTFQKLQEHTVERGQGVKAALSTVQAGVSSALKAVGVENAKADFMGHAPYHILAGSFTTQGALRYGDYVAKIMVRPKSDNIIALAETKHDLGAGFSPLRDDIAAFFRDQGAEFEVCVQLCTELEGMPVEDLTVEWPEEKSPWQPVAKIVVDPQPTYSPERQAYGDDVLSFSPSHSLAAHRPLGSIMRARLQIYGPASEFRHRMNARPQIEPESIDDIPD